MARAKTIVAASVILYINNQPYGRVESFRFSSQTPRDAIYGIDSLDPMELAPTRTKVTGSIGIIRTVGDGGIEGAGFTTNYELLSREKYFSIMLVERQSDTVIFRADYCSVAGQQWDVQARERVKGTLEFEALDWSNELRTEG